MNHSTRPALVGLLFIAICIFLSFTIVPRFLYPLVETPSSISPSPSPWLNRTVVSFVTTTVKGCSVLGSTALILRALIRRRAVARGSGAPPEKEAEARRVMARFAEKYARRTGTKFCRDRRVTARVIEGLAKHKVELGAPLCPCRDYDDKEAEVKRAYWNCPCVPMRTKGHCHCMLFLQPDSDWASDSIPRITVTDIEDLAPDEP